MRILLVEDDDMIGEGLAKALAAAGMSVDPGPQRCGRGGRAA